MFCHGNEQDMYFQSANASELCSCVSVTLTDSQAAAIDRHPKRQAQIVGAILAKGEQARHTEPGCPICNGYGIKPSQNKTN